MKWSMINCYCYIVECFSIRHEIVSFRILVFILFFVAVFFMPLIAWFYERSGLTYFPSNFEKARSFVVVVFFFISGLL